MYGIDTGSLHVYQKTNETKDGLWSLSGDQGNLWSFGQVMMSPVDHPYQVKIELKSNQWHDLTFRFAHINSLLFKFRFPQNPSVCSADEGPTLEMSTIHQASPVKNIPYHISLIKSYIYNLTPRPKRAFFFKASPPVPLINTIYLISILRYGFNS